MAVIEKLTYERRLAAIMFTDLVGYSAVTHASEAHSMRLVELHGRIARESAARRGGTIVKTTGDGFLIEFPSLLQSVACGLEILAAHQTSDQGLPIAERVRLRIGIHVGEVLDHEDDIYGDGVNIAARIQSIAPENSVAFSGQVYDQVRNKLDVPIVALGRLKLKNIRSPIFGYAVVPKGATLRRPRSPTVRTRALAAAVGAIALTSAVAAGTLHPGTWTERMITREPAATLPRIAVLPLTRLSRDPSDEFLAEGLVEELVSRIAGVPGVKVVAKSSTAKLKEAGFSLAEIAAQTHATLVLEGSLRRVDGALRISIKLVDVRKDEIQWAEDFDTSTTGVLHLEQRIAEQVAAHLSAKPVPRTSAAVLADADPNAPENRAQLLYLKGKYLTGRRTRAAMLEAVEQFRLALATRPGFAEAYLGLAHTYELLSFYGFLPAEIAMREQLKYAKLALALAPASGEAHLALAENLAFSKHDWSGAENEYRKALQLDPENAQARHWYADFLMAMGRSEESARESAAALALEPDSLTINGGMGESRYFAGDFAGAAKYYRLTLRMDSTFLPARVMLAKSLMYSGHAAEALATLRDAPAGTGDATAVSNHEYRLTLAVALFATGNKPEALRIIREVTEASRTVYVPAYFIARTEIAVGNSDSALRLIRQAIEEHAAHVAWLRVEPAFIPLHGRPEFEELLRRVGLR